MKNKMNICGHRYKVLFVPSDNENIIDEDGDVAFGKMEPHTSTIYVNSDIPKSIQEETLIHEIIHTIWGHTHNPNDHDEASINSISNEFYKMGIGKFIIEKYLKEAI